MAKQGPYRDQLRDQTGTKAKEWDRPKGLVYKFRPGRGSPFALFWSENGIQRAQYFKDEESREDAAKALADKREEYGREILNFDPREWRTWLAFKAKIGEADPMQVAQEWLVARGGTPGQTLTVAEAVAKYMEFRRQGKLSPDTIRHFEKHLEKRFAATHAAMKLHHVTAEVIQDWLDGLIHPKTKEPMEAVTKRHHRKDLNTFLEYCTKTRGWLLRNPCEAVAVPEIEEEDVELLTVQQVRDLFEKNKGNKILGRLALEAFGFMRASFAGRATKDDIKFDSLGIRMPGPKHKSKKTKFRQGHPDNLWKWLKAAPDECWTMPWWEYRNEKIVAFRVAGLGHSENRLRKTCLSAHLAWLKNPPLTSYLAQHRHTSTTEIYIGMMEEKDGKAYFDISP